MTLWEGDLFKGTWLKSAPEDKSTIITCGEHQRLITDHSSVAACGTKEQVMRLQKNMMINNQFT